MKSILKKMVSVILSLAMVVSLMVVTGPVTSVNAEETKKDGLVLDKTAVIEDDGTITITLEAYATGVTTSTVVTKQVPLDIVLVLDQSGSMAYNFNGESEDNISARRQYAMKNAVNNFIDSVAAKYEDGTADHRMALVTFGSSATTLQEWTNVNATGKNDLHSKINGLPEKPSGATNVAAGMTEAQNLLNQNYTGSNPERKKIVVVFTDGVPTTSSDFNTTVATNSINTAKQMKDANAVIYTVGIFNGANPNQTYGESGFDRNSNGNVGSNWSDFSVWSIGDVKSYDVPAGNRFLNYLSSNYAGATEIGIKNYSSRILGIGYKGWEITKNFTKTANGYYLTAADATALNNVFESISNTVTSGSTSVTLDQTATLKDILSDSFKLPEGYNASTSITVQTQKGTENNRGQITWGSKTTNPAGVSVNANVGTGEIDVTGFNYADKYITAAHPGEKLIVTIRGVEPKASAAGGENVATNSPFSGIYGKDALVASVNFPMPTVSLTHKVYVLDYAKTAVLGNADMSAIRTITNNPGKVSQSNNKVEGRFGTTSLSNNTLTYTPTVMSWSDYDSSFAFGTKNSKPAWTKVSVIPANNIYYEDDFVTNETDGTVGIIYTGDWATTPSKGNTETLNTPHGGWQNVDLAKDDEYSDDSSHLSTGSGSKAEFTFTGKGVDVYSRTNMNAGVVSVKLTDASSNKTVKRLIVDNKANSGDYFQIPTVSFMDLPYGTYTVTISVTNSASSADSSRKDLYYIDGIRVYNPMIEDETVKDAYGEDANAVFTEVRDLLNGSAETGTGAAFIDEVDGESVVASYTSAATGNFAPANEVYLAKGQSIAIAVANGYNYSVGLKALTGSVTANINNGTNVEIAHSTDLYYKMNPVVVNGDAIITITNTSDSILAVTKVKTTGNSVAENGGIETITTFAALEALKLSTEVEPDVEVEEPQQPTTPQRISLLDMIISGIKRLFGR